MDELACNYNSNAIYEDTCVYIELNDNCSVCSGETDGTGVIVNNDIDNDGICDANEILGCQDSNACNYNSLATDQDNCIFINEICDTCSGEIDGTEQLWIMISITMVFVIQKTIVLMMQKMDRYDGVWKVMKYLGVRILMLVITFF